MLSLRVAAAVALLAFCAAVPFSFAPLQIHLKFDENVGSNKFSDVSTYKRDGSCGMSNAACPQTGQGGSSGKAAFFASTCTRSYGSASTADYIKNAATCGSRVNFPSVEITDGTVMLWYKETGDNDGNPQIISAPEAPAVVTKRKPSDFGWDLSLVGGDGFHLGRLSSNFWGGYFCNQWHVSTPMNQVGNAHKGWDHLSWHHVAYVFSGSTVLVYIDGQLAVTFMNTAQCAKSLSFLGQRTVRYTQQNGVRDTEQSSRDRASNNGVYQNVLAAMEWSSNYFKGLIDEFKVYDKVMSQAEIQAAMA